MKLDLSCSIDIDDIVDFCCKDENNAIRTIEKINAKMSSTEFTLYMAIGFIDAVAKQKKTHPDNWEDILEQVNSYE